MDTSAWRQSIRDLPLTQNPELGPAQIGSERFQQVVEATTKDKRTPALATASGTYSIEVYSCVLCVVRAACDRSYYREQTHHFRIY